MAMATVRAESGPDSGFRERAELGPLMRNLGRIHGGIGAQNLVHPFQGTVGIDCGDARFSSTTTPTARVVLVRQPDARRDACCSPPGFVALSLLPRLGRPIL